MMSMVLTPLLLLDKFYCKYEKKQLAFLLDLFVFGNIHHPFTGNSNSSTIPFLPSFSSSVNFFPRHSGNIS